MLGSWSAVKHCACAVGTPLWGGGARGRRRRGPRLGPFALCSSDYAGAAKGICVQLTQLDSLVCIFVVFLSTDGHYVLRSTRERVVSSISVVLSCGEYYYLNIRGTRQILIVDRRAK